MKISIFDVYFSLQPNVHRTESGQCDKVICIQLRNHIASQRPARVLTSPHGGGRTRERMESGNQLRTAGETANVPSVFIDRGTHKLKWKESNDITQGVLQQLYECV